MTDFCIVRIPSPNLQIDFAFALQQVRNQLLLDALKKTIRLMDISVIDRELGTMVPKQSLASFAGTGLRGELLFPMPSVLIKNPKLLGYYRLLLGFSKKTFYSQAFGTTSFVSMEEKGILTKTNETKIEMLCKALIPCACEMLQGIGAESINSDLLDDLTLLTLGPQFRGGANVKIGLSGIIKVFGVIHKIIESHVVSSAPEKIEILNAAQRKVFIEFSSDPDIIISEEMAQNTFRYIIAIEIKGGTDFSNIHNRLGEAEKSHQKARKKGHPNNEYPVITIIYTM
jgi:hypothetical protein